MAGGANILVMNKIDSLNVDDETKRALKDLFQSEISNGASTDREVKVRKIKTCRRIVERRKSP